MTRPSRVLAERAGCSPQAGVIVTAPPRVCTKGFCAMPRIPGLLDLSQIFDHSHPATCPLAPLPSGKMGPRPVPTWVTGPVSHGLPASGRPTASAEAHWFPHPQDGARAPSPRTAVCPLSLPRDARYFHLTSLELVPCSALNYKLSFTREPERPSPITERAVDKHSLSVRPEDGHCSVSLHEDAGFLGPRLILHPSTGASH